MEADPSAVADRTDSCVDEVALARARVVDDCLSDLPFLRATATGNTPYAVAVDVTGAFAYVVNYEERDAQNAGPPGGRGWRPARAPGLKRFAGRCIPPPMPGNHYAELLFTDAVRSEQARAGSRAAYARMAKGDPTNDHLGPEEIDFITAQDHFFLATTGETGYPYLQHRGGKPGLLHVLDPHTVGFADVRGNRQYISVGNLKQNDRVSICFSMRRRAPVSSWWAAPGW